MEQDVKYKQTAEAETDGQLPWTSLAIASRMATQEAAHIPWCLLPAAWADSALLQTATGGSCGLQCLPGICHCPTGGQRGASGGHCGAPPQLLSSISRQSVSTVCLRLQIPSSVAKTPQLLGVHHGFCLGRNPSWGDRQAWDHPNAV